MLQLGLQRMSGRFSASDSSARPVRMRSRFASAAHSTELSAALSESLRRGLSQAPDEAIGLAEFRHEQFFRNLSNKKNWEKIKF